MRFATRPTGSARRILLAGSLSIGLILAANALAFLGLWSVLRDPALSAP